MKLLKLILLSSKKEKLDFNQRAIDFISLLETCQKHYKTSRSARNGFYFLTTDAPPDSSFMAIAMKLGLVSYDRKDATYDFSKKHIYKYHPDKINMKDGIKKEK